VGLHFLAHTRQAGVGLHFLAHTRQAGVGLNQVQLRPPFFAE
jgi:hypothetical protein